MWKTNKKLKEDVKDLESRLKDALVLKDYQDTKIKDDFTVLNQVLDLKISHYEDVIFIYNRYTEEKKVDVSTEEIDKATTDIITETFKALSDTYIDYLSTKYFKSHVALIDTYTQQVYIRLFAFANNYNVGKLQKDFKKG